MKRIYYNYKLWEDFQNGFYEVRNIKNEEFLIIKAKKLLTDKKAFSLICSKVCKEWSKACEVNFTNKSCNQIAWLGQASCCYKYKVPEHLTRQAWNLLTEKQQNEANKIAQDSIMLWKKNYLKRLKNA